ncbi:hypothetical protein [Actomonas aquatica]|uniref:Glycoside hydrolase family 5 domain-containing protein n=1 Tax=Actomonas aquatica TaxID=2866162 RepID=A0ABZ1CB26_9BACT|nr:hypothetical protein [Opitutus sp. WL0086]WRQ88580.1 hypothetical protein K1X11_004135 [Opitutus sp. WL0086]
MLVSLWGLLSFVAAQSPLGFDMGPPPEAAARTINSLNLNNPPTGWMRFRRLGPGAIMSPARPDETSEGVQERRDALTHIRERGIRAVAILEWPRNWWNSGLRATPSELPLDLTEAYRRCRDLAYTYGDLIDAWEIENEPDIGFVKENAETFAAFYKACALGILAGREAAASSNSLNVQSRIVDSSELQLASKFDESGNAAASDIETFGPSDLQTVHDRAGSAIMHAPLALPPGPYWQELVANDTLRYTEAFNYHFYGYPEDFKGVRDAWVAALEAATEASERRSENGADSEQNRSLPETEEERDLPQKRPLVASGAEPTTASATTTEPAEQAADDLQTFRPLDLKTPSKTPALPLFLTEYGYGLLDRYDRHTVAGRERQKRFFKLILPHVTDGTITGAMVYMMLPTQSPNGSEFGLLAEVPKGLRQESKGLNVSGLSSFASASADKNVTEPPPPSPPTTSPDATHPDESAASTVASTRPSDSQTLRRLDSTGLSPVVIDFIAGEDTRSVKRYNGHLLQRREAATAEVSSGKNQVPGVGLDLASPSATTDADEARQRVDGATKSSRPEGVTQSVAYQADEEQPHATADQKPSRPSDLRPLYLRSEATSSGDFTLVLYNFSDEPVTGTLSIALENGEIRQRQQSSDRSPSSPDVKRRDESAAHVRHSNEKATAEASAKEDTDLKTSDTAEPYRRPPTPRSSLNPPSEPDWPNADSRFITTSDGKTYAITPALELLLETAATDDRRTEDGEQESVTGEPKTPTSSTAVAGVGAPGTQSLSPEDSRTEAGRDDVPSTEPPVENKPEHSPSDFSVSTFQHFSVSSISLAPMERRVLHFTATLPNQEFRPHRLWAFWNLNDDSTDASPDLEEPSDPAVAGLSVAQPKTSEADSQPLDSRNPSSSDPAVAKLGIAQPKPLAADSISASQRLSFQRFDARLATRLYPSPAAFRFETLDTFSFTAEDNAAVRARQLARPRVAEEAQLYQHPTAQRWLTTPGVEIEETPTTWRITINDLPPEPLRPAELELPFPSPRASRVAESANLSAIALASAEATTALAKEDPDAALSLKYRLIIPASPSVKRSDESADLSAKAHAAAEATTSLAKEEATTSSSRYEELDINFRDASGTLWGVWPRLTAQAQWRSYLEPLTNFTPMFFSRAPVSNSKHEAPVRLPVRRNNREGGSLGEGGSAFSPNEFRSLVLLFRPRVLPTVIEIEKPRTVRLAPR